MNPTHHLHEDDTRIDSLLTELGSATPSSGFEQRVFRNVQLSLVEQPYRPSWRFWQLGIAAALACLLSGFFTLHQWRHRPGDVATHLVTASAGSMAHAQPPLGQIGTQLAPHTTHPFTSARLPRKRLPPATSAPPTSEAQTLASFPAPPLPLTEQERLMLNIIHKGDPEEIAMLNPEFRESLVTRDQAEFKEFFKAPPLPQEPDPVPPANPKGVSK